MKIEKSCIVCGAQFGTLTYSTDRGWGKYCSRKCMSIDYGKNRVMIICKTCGKEKYKSPSQKHYKYCSSKCYHKGQVGSKRPAHSLWMLKQLKIYNPLKGKHLTDDHRLKLSGKNNPRWKGGISSIYHRIRMLPEFFQWRLGVYKHDNFTCQDCGKVGVRLEVHHKIGYSKILTMSKIKTIRQALLCGLLWDMENGQTLCRKCHKKTESYGRNSSED